MERLEGWEQRLNQALLDARGWSYVQGQCDCITVVCRCIEALTLVDLWPRWAGRYSDQRGAVVAIAKTADYEQPYLTRAVSKTLGVEPVPVAQLGRGDVIEWHLDDGPHLGVVLHTEAMGFGPDGVYFLPVREGAHGWRVG